MPKTRAEKEKTVADLTGLLRQMKAAVFADFAGLKVKDITNLRRQCRQAGLEYAVAKKTLLKLALQQAGLAGIEPKTIGGSFATVFGRSDEVTPAKILSAFAKTNESLKILGGILEGRYIDAKMVISLSKLPGREELMAKLLGSLNSPLSGLANVMSGSLRGLVQALKALREKKQATI